MKPTLLDELTAATDGLEFMSETDAPIEPVLWDVKLPLDHAKLLERLDLPPETPVQVLDLTTFFRSATTIRDWFGPDETAQAQRFVALVTLLNERLHEPQVYKIGSINFPVYVLGQTADGKLAGVHTRVVET